MNSNSRRSFHLQWVVLSLAMLLKLQGFAEATPLEKEVPGHNLDTPSGYATPGEEDNASPQKPKLKKPKPLEPTKLAQEDPLASLDKLIVKQQIPLTPYVPLVQVIDVVIDYDKLAMNLWKILWNVAEREYAGGFHLLLRKNIQLSGNWGDSQLRPARVAGNQNAYTVQGKYGSYGVAYFTRYDLYNNLYIGVRYARSYFKNSTVPKKDTDTVITKDLTASWWELVIGSEQQLRENWGFYAGLLVHIKGFGRFGSFEPASNYVVPGYGRSVSSIVPAISFYIKYKISFLEKQLSFGTPTIS